MNQNAKIQLFRGQDRGHTQLDWLDSRHSFSFGDYYEPERMGFRSLRVINDDIIASGQGFGEHPHRDMEIITYVVEGELKHQDSLGHGSVIQAGCVQKMSAGTGIRHSEFNASKTKQVHLYQIWILPTRRGLPPAYEEFPLNMAEAEGLILLASPEGGKNIITIHQDVRMYFGRLDRQQKFKHSLAENRGVWVQVIKGDIKINDLNCAAGDGVTVEDAAEVALYAEKSAEFLLFDCL